MSHPGCLFTRRPPGLIERLLPVQKLSARSTRNRWLCTGKTLTALGSYWKGRKPLILNKACILGCRLPATDDPRATSKSSRSSWRWTTNPSSPAGPADQAQEILATLSIARIADYFTAKPGGVLPESGPVDWSQPEYEKVKVAWREALPELERRRLEAQMLPKVCYRERVEEAKRPEEVMDIVHDHIWDAVTPTSVPAPIPSRNWSSSSASCASAIGRGWLTPSAAPARSPSRPRGLAATCMPPTSTRSPACSPGAPSTSSAVPRRAARISPVPAPARAGWRSEIDRLGIEQDDRGKRAKVFLYCFEALCPRTGWRVPLLPTRVVSTGPRPCGAELVGLIPDAGALPHRSCCVGGGASIPRGRGKALCGSDGCGRIRSCSTARPAREYRTAITILRGDHRKAGRASANRPTPLGAARLRAAAGRPLSGAPLLHPVDAARGRGQGHDQEFRGVTTADLARERNAGQRVGRAPR